MRILIADDNERVRSGIKSLLALEPECEVCGEAHDGEDAIAKARELHPDLILLDISMPGMNGLDAARALRQVSNCKILIMSQHDPTVLKSRALSAGAQGCLDKARLVTDLMPAIASLLREPTPSPTRFNG
jgi:DNA-binding NarL/FixJ family response regulator